MKGDIFEMSVFKSYLRQLLVQLKDLQESIRSGDMEKAGKTLDLLIQNTQAGIEDD